MPQFLSPPAFDRPEYLVESTWLEHAPFAYHIVFVLQPKIFVELGTSSGFSFFSFCQAIQRYSTGTFAYAVNSWSEGEHTETYDLRIYEDLLRVRRQYGSFSTLIRSSFSDARPSFGEKSIDLIHIDGHHDYAEIKITFEEWLPKLTEDAIVLFHDTNVREPGFGVWRYFEELKNGHPSFNFLHGNGLGVLALGEVPGCLRAFFDADSITATLIRAIYSRLGRSVTDAYTAARLVDIEARYQAKLDFSATSASLDKRVSDLTNVTDQRVLDLANLADQHAAAIAKLSERVFSDPLSSASERIERRVSALEELSRKLDVAVARLKEDTTLVEVRDGSTPGFPQIERRLLKAERRIKRLTWHTAVLMPITGPIVIVLRFLTRRLKKFRSKIKQRGSLR